MPFKESQAIPATQVLSGTALRKTRTSKLDPEEKVAQLPMANIPLGGTDLASPGTKPQIGGYPMLTGGGNPMSVADGWLLAAFAAAMSLNGFLGYMLYLTF